jgi:hypothetical protein
MAILPRLSHRRLCEVAFWHEGEVPEGRRYSRFWSVSGPVADIAKPAILTLNGHSRIPIRWHNAIAAGKLDVRR